MLEGDHAVCGVRYVGWAWPQVVFHFFGFAFSTPRCPLLKSSRFPLKWLIPTSFNLVINLTFCYFLFCFCSCFHLALAFFVCGTCSSFQHCIQYNNYSDNFYSSFGFYCRSFSVNQWADFLGGVVMIVDSNSATPAFDWLNCKHATTFGTQQGPSESMKNLNKLIRIKSLNICWTIY